MKNIIDKHHDNRFASSDFQLMVFIFSLLCRNLFQRQRCWGLKAWQKIKSCCQLQICPVKPPRIKNLNRTEHFDTTEVWCFNIAPIISVLELASNKWDINANVVQLCELEARVRPAYLKLWIILFGIAFMLGTILLLGSLVHVRPQCEFWDGDPRIGL